MTELADASINSFGPMPEAEVVPPEDPIFVLTSSQLREIITRAIQPVKDEVLGLRATVASQGEEIAALKATVGEQKADYESMNDLRCEDFSNLARRLNAHLMKDREPGKTELSRAEKIEKYLASRPDHKATFETLKGMLQVDNVLLSQAIKTLMDSSPGRYGIVRTPGDKRKRTLVMLPK